MKSIKNLRLSAALFLIITSLGVLPARADDEESAAIRDLYLEAAHLFHISQINLLLLKGNQGIRPEVRPTSLIKTTWISSLNATEALLSKDSQKVIANTAVGAFLFTFVLDFFSDPKGSSTFNKTLLIGKRIFEYGSVTSTISTSFSSIFRDSLTRQLDIASESLRRESEEDSRATINERLAENSDFVIVHELRSDLSPQDRRIILENLKKANTLKQKLKALYPERTSTEVDNYLAALNSYLMVLDASFNRFGEYTEEKFGAKDFSRIDTLIETTRAIVSTNKSLIETQKQKGLIPPNSHVELSTIETEKGLGRIENLLADQKKLNQLKSEK